MHYIRFLKLPKLAVSNKDICHLSAKITITNDLGELFLTTALPLECVLVVHLNSTQTQQHIYLFEWRPHSRALDTNFTFSAKYLRDARGKALPCELIVQSSPKENDASSRGTVKNQQSTSQEGRVISIYSEPFGFDNICTSAATVRRLLSTNGQDVTVIREEKGESIARHIWDAGLVLSELLHTMIHGQSRVARQLPLCSAALKTNDLKAIELGTGVGLVGLALADVLADGEHGSAKVLLTDLDDAREIVEVNMAEMLKAKNRIAVEFTELDWTEPLPRHIEEEDWDVVLIADCTYNPDYAKALASTIKSLMMRDQDTKLLEKKSEPLALLAMKPRHSAENVFFDYMNQAGMKILEEVRIPVQVLGGESQEIRILGFGLS